MDEVKELAKAWGFWLALGFVTIDDRHNRNLADTISLVLFAIVTLAVIGTTLRSLYRFTRALHRLTVARRSAEADPTG
ncbi:hypothetical protein ACWGI1_15515 [Streptomyces sp. NPDC054835]